MVQSLARLLGESIDFAVLGGSPSPAEPIATFLRHQSAAESIVLSRFVCPASRLTSLIPVLESSSIDCTFPIAVTGKPTQTAAEWEDQLAACAEDMNAFEKSTSDWIEVAAFEIKPPPSYPEADVLRDLKGFSEVDVFIEAPKLSAIDGLVAAAADSDWAFLKVDLSGRPDSFVVAKLLHEAIAVELPFKVVQGNGEAISHGGVYGVLNLLGAAAIGIAEDLSSRELEAVLIDPESTHWRFENGSLSFRGWEADLAAIEQARDVLIEIQCESIDRALRDLAAMGLWHAEER